LESDLNTEYHSFQTNFCREMLFFGKISISGTDQILSYLDLI